MGQQIQADFLFKEVKTGVTKRNTQFARGTLSDKSGSVVFVMWDLGPSIPAVDTIYHVTGSVSEYEGKPQIKIERLAPRESTDDEDFAVTSSYSVEEMWAKVCGYIEGFESTYFRTVAFDLMHQQGFEEGFRISPAASYMHHAFVGGLLEHTSQMCETVEKLFTLPFYRDALNKDLCMFGVLFHDFGKMFEYQQSAGFKKTVQGLLVPHIPMTSQLVFETCNKFGVPEVIRDHMCHVILAHHGKLAYGSPVDMATPEAAFVHHVDNLHGDVFGWIQKIATSTHEEYIKHSDRQLITVRFSEVLRACEEREATTPTSSS
jgi:3'-5' exoribonuclease